MEEHGWGEMQWPRRPVDRRARRGELPSMRWSRLALLLALSGLRSPATGAALLRVAWRFRRTGWWRRPPFLPVPSARYVRWRMHTAYGDEGFVPPADDVIRYARWAVRAP
jgi:hypothetical protein